MHGGDLSCMAFAHDHNLTNRLHAFIWLENICCPSRNVCQPDMGHSLLTAGHTEMGNLLQRWILNVLRDLLGVKTTTPSWSILQECGIDPFQFNCQWFRATMFFYNSLSKCNSLLLKKVLHADISLNSITDSCWTSHLLSALDGLAHSDLMKRQIMACDPVNLRSICGGHEI
eukprot:1142554-Pelagomonas_calceolata.AAC.2